MVRNIRDRLKSSGISNRVKNNPSKSFTPLEKIMDIEEVETPFGTHLLKKSRFPLSYRHGKFPLKTVFELPQETLVKVIQRENFHSLNIRDFVFLDTETTGLAGGAGTVAFLIGIGYFTDKEFVVDQFFMRDFHEEPSVLYMVKDLIDRYKVIVSFNGKVFDWPLLKDRFAMHRLTLEKESFDHFDLLFASRRLWKERLASCCLSSIEENILQVKRKDDIPGELIPSVYFDYLREREGGPIKKVFRHNLKDILSLVTLTGCVGTVINNPLPHCYPEDLYCLGKLFKSTGDLEKSCECFLEAAKRAQTPVIKQKSLKELSFLLKQKGEYDRAVDIWRWMISKNTMKLFPYIEWAKHLEHREKNYTKAIKVVKRAIEIAHKRRQVFGNIKNNTKVLQELRHRLERLEKKQARVREFGNNTG